MKVNWILLTISAVVAALLGYAIYAGTNNYVLTIGGALVFFLTLCGVLSISLGKGTINLRVLSGFFFLIMIVEHLLFALIGFKLSAYIVITGIFISIYIISFYGISKAITMK